MTQQVGLNDAELAVRKTVYAADAFAGQVALISGGAGGLGRAVAWLLARLGAHVVITGRKQDKIDALVGKLHAADLKASGYVVDIRDQDNIARVMGRIIVDCGRLDLLINSAGGQFPMAAIDIPEKGWNAVINTNLSGTWNMMQAAASHWRSSGTAGNIINIVVVTRQGLHGVAHTIAARAGVVGLSENLAVEWAEHGIRINCIAPGTIETEGWAVYSPEVRAKYPKSNPMRHVGTAWDVAEACAYLGGPAAGYVTGETLNIAGGSQLWGETWTIPKPDYFKN